MRLNMHLRIRRRADCRIGSGEGKIEEAIDALSDGAGDAKPFTWAGRPCHGHGQRPCRRRTAATRTIHRRHAGQIPPSPTSNPGSASTRPQTLQLGSPFDYASQATLYLETDLPEPNDTLRFLAGGLRQDHAVSSISPAAARLCCSPATRC